MILLEIIKQKSLTVTELSNVFHVSERTIRMDLSEIDYFLELKKIKPLNKENGLITFAEDNQIIGVIYSLINEKDIVTASYLPSERILDILFQIAMSESPIRLEDLSAELLVSKSTIVKDIEKAKLIAADSGYSLVGTPDGMTIRGDEYKIRSAIINAYIYSLDKTAMTDIRNLLKDANNPVTYKVQWKIFEGSNYEFINGLLDFLTHALNVKIYDFKYILVAGHLSMMIKRILNKKYIKKRIYVAASVYEPIIDQVFDKIKDYCNCDLCNEEKDYIRYIIYVLSYEAYYADNYTCIETEKAHDIARHLLDGIGKQNDLSAVDSLAYELIILRIDKELGMPTKSNVITLPDRLYQDIYTQVSMHSSLLKEFTGFELKENQLWRLCYPIIDAEIEQVENKPKTVVLITDKSQQLTDILIHHLKALFCIEIAGICGIADAHQMIREVSPDCVICTMHNYEIPDVITVHPILSAANVTVLKERLPIHRIGVHENDYALHSLSDGTIDLQIKDVEIGGSLFPEVDHIAAMEMQDVTTPRYQKHLMNSERKNALIINGTMFLNVLCHETVLKDRILILSLKKSVQYDKQLIHTVINTASTSNASCALAYSELIQMANQGTMKKFIGRKKHERRN
jgi:hypothetical protein